MMNIAPLLTPSQPTSPPTTNPGSSQGSESIFGKIFGQKMTARQSPESKLSSTQNTLSRNESPSANHQNATSSETDTPSPFQETEIAATEAVPAKGSIEDQQFNGPEASEMEATFSELISPLIAKETSDTNQSVTVSDTSQESGAKGFVVEKSDNSAQTNIQIQNATLTQSPENFANEAKGIVTETPKNSSTVTKPIYDALSEPQDHKYFRSISPEVNVTNIQKITSDQHYNQDVFVESKAEPAGFTPPNAGKGRDQLFVNSETVGRSIPAPQFPYSSTTQAPESQATFKDNNTIITSVLQSSVIVSNETTNATVTPLSSSAVQSLWPADTPLSGNEKITISGYFTAAKIEQPSSTLQNNTVFPDIHPVVATDSANEIQPKAAATLTQGLRFLEITPEKTPVSMAVISPMAAHTRQQMAAETAPLMVSLNQLTSLKSTAVDNQEKHPSFTVEPLRNQFHEQQLQIKTEAKNGEGNEQQFTSKQGTATATLTQSPQVSVISSTDQPLSFSEVSQAMMTSTQSHTTPVNPQPISPAVHLPPVVHDNSVLQQVAERFQLQMQNQETKLRIQLQPAELGKLDINLSVKEGSIRAHVVAQSGQVQELLERNMTKLKGILESQGFSIEEILVSTASESVSNSDLFHDQATRHQNQASSKSHFSDTPFSDTLENLVTSDDEPATSVNITA